MYKEQDLFTKASELQFKLGKKKEAYVIYKSIIENYPDFHQKAVVQQMMRRLEKEGISVSAEEEQEIAESLDLQRNLRVLKKRVDEENAPNTVNSIFFEKSHAHIIDKLPPEDRELYLSIGGANRAKALSQLFGASHNFDNVKAIAYDLETVKLQNAIIIDLLASIYQQNERVFELEYLQKIKELN